MRHVAPAWEAALNGGKESVVCDLPGEPEFAQALLRARRRRPRGLPAGRRGEARRRPRRRARPSAVYCSITGFGADGPHVARAGHDLNYLGWAGMLEDTAPGLPPLQPADLAAGALGAVVEVLAALLERERTGRGARLTVSMTHGSHRLVSHRARRRPAAALPHRRARLLRDLRDRRRAPAHRRRARAEVLRPALRGDRAPGARGAPLRPGRRRRSSRAELARDLRDPLRSPTGWSSSTARTSASARSRRSTRRRRRSAREPPCRPPASGSIRAHGGQSSASPDRSGAGAAAAARRPGLGRRCGSGALPREARRLRKGGEPLCRRPRDHDGRHGHRARLVARPALDRLRPAGPRQAHVEPLSDPQRRWRPAAADRGDQVVAMPAWRGDGRLLAYAASPLAGGSFDIWTVDPAGGRPKLVATGAAEQLVPVVHTRGQDHVPHPRARRALPREDE